MATIAAPQLDSRNANTLWASVLVETLHRCGVRQVVVSPGSRSTPLTLAFARHEGLEAIPVLDERSAAFFALGLAKQTRNPVALLCTSGTAAANYLPAIIEAHESGVPLVVLTADRPPELRDCASGQTIDQQKLFGGFVRAYHELAVPEPRYELLCYLRQTVASACRRAASERGPVHLNIPFRDPLVPTPDAGEAATGAEARAATSAEARAASAARQIRESFFEHLGAEESQPVGALELTGLTAQCGVIIAGPQWERDPREYAAQVARLALELGWPVLADGVSPLRHHAAEGAVVVTAYDAILRSEAAHLALRPTQVLCLGDWPTSKVLRASVAAWEPEIFQVTPLLRNRDALHGRTRQITAPFASLRASEKSRDVAYLQAWAKAEGSARQLLDTLLSRAHQETSAAEILEAAVVPTLARALPEGATVFVASSMPIRDVEYFWPKNERGLEFYFNRGANGIDGTLSTALGVAQLPHNFPASPQVEVEAPIADRAPALVADRASAPITAPAPRPTFLLCGDLSFLHDSNGLLLAQKLRGSLTVILINNHGGGIFEHLPIADYDPPFEEFFATPQSVDFATLCAAYGVAHRAITTLAQLETELGRAPQPEGVRVLELHTDRKASAAHRKALFAKASAAVSPRY